MYLPTSRDPRVFLGQNALSFSEMSTLSQCEKKWKLQYDTDQEKDFAPSPAMELGSEMHRLLGLWWGPGGPESLQSENPTAQWLMGRYNEYYMEQAALLHMINTEIPFAVRLPGILPLWFFGWFDGLVKDYETGDLWIAEFKTMGNWSKLNQLPVDKQITAYIYAARQSGYDVKGVMYDAIRTYMWTGKNAADHVPAESFERVFVERTDEQIQEWLDEVDSAVSVKLDLRYNLRVPLRNVGQNCDWCPVMPECYGINLTVTDSSATVDF